MYELKVTVTRVLGTCTAEPPMKAGDSFQVSDGQISIPAGGYVCIWALQSLLPLLPAKEREIAEEKDEDWMWRVHHAQCPDPEGRVVFEIERTGKVRRTAPGPPVVEKARGDAGRVASPAAPHGLRDLRVVVDAVHGRCTSGLQPGDTFALRCGRLTIPAGRHFCLHALQAVLPFLAAKQRPLPDEDWLKETSRFICPDPAGNVLLRVEPL